MSTSVLYRALGIRGYKHQSIRNQDGGIVLRARHDGKSLSCPHCGSANVGQRAGKPVRLRFVLKNADLYSLRFAK